MNTAPLAFAVSIAILSTAVVATSQTLHHADPNRPTDLIAADLNVPEATFIACFSGVSPDPGHNPSGARQHANKAILLPCLQAANPAITNDLLDEVMDRYRPEGPIRKS